MKRAALLSVIGVFLLGAPAHAQIYHANDTGGIIPWSCENEAMAQQIAGAYCARWDKYHRITSVHRQYGDFIAFNCLWSPTSTPMRCRRWRPDRPAPIRACGRWCASQLIGSRWRPEPNLTGVTPVGIAAFICPQCRAEPAGEFIAPAAEGDYDAPMAAIPGVRSHLRRARRGRSICPRARPGCGNSR